MRLIDADALIYSFCENPSYSAAMFSKIKGLIKAAPTIEAEPVKHGRWDERNIYICTSDGEPVACIGREYKCSECGRTENKQEPYCHCGAKMDGGADNG